MNSVWRAFHLALMNRFLISISNGNFSNMASMAVWNPHNAPDRNRQSVNHIESDKHVPRCLLRLTSVLIQKKLRKVQENSKEENLCTAEAFSPKLSSQSVSQRLSEVPIRSISRTCQEAIDPKIGCRTVWKLLKKCATVLLKFFFRVRLLCFLFDRKAFNFLFFKFQLLCLVG